MLFEPCGELRRDYGAYCETLRLTEREDIFSDIYTNVELAKEKERRHRMQVIAEHNLIGEHAEAEAEAMLLKEREEAAALALAAATAAAESAMPAEPVSPPRPPSPPPKQKKTRSDSSRGKKGTPAKTMEPPPEAETSAFVVEPVPTLTFIRIRHPKFCINQRDITPLCRAIPYCSSLVSVEFTGAGLSVESYMLLTEAIYRSRRVVSIRIDFNSVTKPGFYPDPTVVARPEKKNSIITADPDAPPNADTAAIAAAVPPSSARSGASTTPTNTPRNTTPEKKKSNGKKDGKRLSMSAAASIAAAAAAAAAESARLAALDEPGVIFLKPTEFCGLHLIPTALEEQINDEKEKKGKVDPKKLALLQTQQETIQRFNEVHRIRLPRSWEAMLFTAVAHLSLRGNGIDDDCVCRMVRLITINPNSRLLSLNLWGNRITDVGANAVAKLLRTNRTLRALDLGHNLISDRGLLDIVNTFRMVEMTSMEELNLYRRRVLNRATASEKERAAALQPFSSTIPTYQDMYNVWHAIRFPPSSSTGGSGGSGSGGGGGGGADDKSAGSGKESGKRGNASKNKVKEPPPPTLVRPSGPFDRECIRLAPGDPCIRVPGNAVLEVLNLAENDLVSIEGMREAVRILSLREPRTDADMLAMTSRPMIGAGAGWSTACADGATAAPGVTGEDASPTHTVPLTPDPPSSARAHSVMVGATSSSSSAVIIYPPELHCAGLRLRTCTLFHYQYKVEDPIGDGEGVGHWREMSEEQQKLNACLDEWLASSLDAQKPPPTDKSANSGRRKNH